MCIVIGATIVVSMAAIVYCFHLLARSRTSALELLDRQCRELQCQVSGLESEIRMLEDETTGMGEEGGERERCVLDDAELEGTMYAGKGWARSGSHNWVILRSRIYKGIYYM